MKNLSRKVHKTDKKNPSEEGLSEQRVREFIEVLRAREPRSGGVLNDHNALQEL